MRFARLAALATLALALLAAPLAAEAQPTGRVPRIGILANARSPFTEGFERGLKDFGYEDGKNIFIEWRWAQGDLARLPALAAELVQLKVDVILAATEAYVNAARQATSTIPIVFQLSPTLSPPGTWRAFGGLAGTSPDCHRCGTS